MGLSFPAKSLAREIYAIFDGAQQPLEYVAPGSSKSRGRRWRDSCAERRLIVDVGGEFGLAKSVYDWSRKTVILHN